MYVLCLNHTSPKKWFKNDLIGVCESCKGMEKWNLFLGYLLSCNTTDYVVDLTHTTSLQWWAKVLEHISFCRAFFNSTCPTPPSTSQKTLDAYTGQVSKLYRIARENCKKTLKKMHLEIKENCEACITVPTTFVQDWRHKFWNLPWPFKTFYTSHFFHL